MSSQRLSARSVRRIERDTNFPILRAWSHGGYVMAFVTSDHRHGWWDKKTGQWGWDTGGLHYTSCSETWPQDVTRDRAQHREAERRRLMRIPEELP